MCYTVQLKGGIYEVNFGYNVKKEVYASSSSDIPELCEIVSVEVLIKGINRLWNIIA